MWAKDSLFSNPVYLFQIDFRNVVQKISSKLTSVMNWPSLPQSDPGPFWRMNFQTDEFPGVTFKCNQTVKISSGFFIKKNQNIGQHIVFKLFFAFYWNMFLLSYMEVLNCMSTNNIKLWTDDPL